MQLRWHNRSGYGPILFLLLIVFSPAYLYMIVRRQFGNFKLKLILLGLGLVFMLVQVLFLVLVLYFNSLEIVLPPWSNQVFTFWGITVGVIFLIVFLVCRYVKKMALKWAISLFCIVTLFTAYLYVVDFIDYYYAVIFRSKNAGDVFALMDAPFPPDRESIKEYMSIGNYKLAGSVDPAFEENSKQKNTFIVNGYQVSLSEEYEKIESSSFLAAFTSDNYFVFFVQPFNYSLEYKKVIQDSTKAYTFKSSDIKRAFDFQDNYSLIREMLMTTYEDIEDTNRYSELLRKESLYVSKVMALDFLPPVYEFNNGHIKGFMGQNQAICYKVDNTLLFEVRIKGNQSAEITESATDYLKKIVLFIQKAE